MSYEKRNFQSGGTLYASDLNAMDEQIYKNASAIEKFNASLGIGMVEPSDDDIPKVFFSKPVPQTKDDVVTAFRYVSKTQDISGYAEFKAQGNSSMLHPKKNMTVKLYTDETLEEKLKVDFKGWGKQNKFCLKANYTDITHSRNVVAARLWRQVVETRKNELPTGLQNAPCLGAVDGFPVKVYANGIYQGRYSWNIPKDKWTFNMDDSLDTNVVLCGESNDEGTPSVFATSSDTINGTYWSDEIHKTVPESVITAWNRVLKFANESTNEEFTENLSNYFDVDLLIDYLCFHIILGNGDAFGKNQLATSYDLQKWYILSYDMDVLIGLQWNGLLELTPTADTGIISVPKRNQLMLKLVRNFQSRITERYNLLRSGVLSFDNIINEFEKWISICPNDLVVEDYAVTTANGAFTSMPTKATENNIQQIRKWIIERLAYVDANAPTFKILDEEKVPCTGITLSTSSLSFTSKESQTLTATVTPEDTTNPIKWESNNTNVATVSNGVVTPVANGDCTITVTCGEQSAICLVNVNIAFDIDTTGLMYSLPETMILDGANHIDTGVKLLDEDKDFTVFLDYQDSGSSYLDAWLHCVNEASPNSGLAFEYERNSSYVNTMKLSYYTANGDDTTCLHAPDKNRHKLLVTHKAGEQTKITYYYDNTTPVEYTGGATYEAVTQNLLVGAYQDKNGNINRYANGTVFDVKVWLSQVDEETIIALMSE